MPEKKIAVVTDSACDLPDALLEKYQIRFVSLRVVLKRGEYRDRVEIGEEALYKILEGGELPKSSLPLPGDVLSVYDALHEEGYTDVIHVCISSGLSGTYHMVRLLAEEYDKLRVHAFDSRTLSMQEGFIALECARMLERTQDIKQILAMAEKMRESSIGMFVIRTLEYLRKGGRIGLVEGVLGTMLNVKPIIFVNDDGIYETLTKARGHVNAVEAMVKSICARFADKAGRLKVAVVHGLAYSDAERLMERLKGLLNIDEGFILPVSPVLGVHTGPGLLGIVACLVNG